jgi:hypothetical protein
MPQFRRLQNWPTLMHCWLRDNAAQSFAWGRWDCALMAAKHVDCITGTWHQDIHGGKYDDADSAASYLASLGTDGLGGLATQILGAPLANKKMAQRGDVVTFKTTLGPALGIVDLSGMKIIGLDPKETGFIRLPLALSTSAWRV